VGGNAKLDNGLSVSGNVTYVNSEQRTPPSGGSVFGGNFGSADASIFYTSFLFAKKF
jgi:hypothetical protein